jgi:SAM-dependent methyltransferase
VRRVDPLDATRRSYDAVAETYVRLFGDELAGKPLDRALLAAFVETVSGPVADLGCGPGHVTAHLRGLGCQAFGVDLSPEMVEAARRAYPAVSFSQGDMTQLDISSGSLGGIVAFYSIIHLPPDLLPLALPSSPGCWRRAARCCWRSRPAPARSATRPTGTATASRSTTTAALPRT